MRFRVRRGSPYQAFLECRGASMGEYVIVVCVAVTCIGAATALGAEVKVDGQYAACRVRNLWSDTDTCAEDVSPPDDDAFPLPDRASLPVPEGVWVRGSDHELPVRLTGVSGMSQAELAALLSEQGLTQVTDPDLLRAANAVSAGQTESSEGRSNVESLYTKYGKDNITLVFQAPQTSPPTWKTLARRWLPLAVADALLGTLEAQPPDDFFGGPWNVDVDGQNVVVTRTRLEGGQDCLLLQDTSSRTGTACLAEGTEAYVSPTTGDVLATRGPMGPVLDRDAVREEVRDFEPERASPWVVKRRKQQPEYVMGVAVDPYRWVQRPDGKWIDQTDGSVHARPEIFGDDEVSEVVKGGHYYRNRAWETASSEVLKQMAKMVSALFLGEDGGPGDDPDLTSPVTRAWLALALLHSEVESRAVRSIDGVDSASALMAVATDRIRAGEGILARPDIGDRVAEAARSMQLPGMNRVSAEWLNRLTAEQWAQAQEDVGNLTKVVSTAAQIAGVSRSHHVRAARMAGALKAMRLAQSGWTGDREAAIAILIEVAQINQFAAFGQKPVSDLIDSLASWWTEPLARRLPSEVTAAITAVIGVPGAVDTSLILESIEPERLHRAVDQTLGAQMDWSRYAGPIPIQVFRSVQAGYGGGDWIRLIEETTGIAAMRPYLKGETLRATTERSERVARFDGMLNSDGSRNWETMAARALRRPPDWQAQDAFAREASEDRRKALTLAFGPRLDDFVRYVTDELNAEQDWSSLPRAGEEPRVEGSTVNFEGISTIALPTLPWAADPYLATAVIDSSRVLAAYADKWALTQTPESSLEEELLREATFAGRIRGDSQNQHGAVDTYREVIVEGAITIAQAYTQLLGAEPASTSADRDRLIDSLERMRGPILTIAMKAPFGVIGPRTQEGAESAETDDRGAVVIPRKIAKAFGGIAGSATATGFGCPVAHGHAQVCNGELKPINSLDKLIRLFNDLTREALRRGVEPANWE